MVMKIGKRAFLCSGSLVNNTARDKKPYVLSAFHCTEDLEYNVSASKEDYNQWMFYFHLEHTGCDNTSPIQNYKTIQGCSRVVAIPVENVQTVYCYCLTKIFLIISTFISMDGIEQTA